ncbi:MAG: endolytic transglycosylase MltG [Gammaproteobacteria bacterium]|nr:endolytic transglycosylase MltG [Gammaproteobacteria bacterium]MDH4253893.1 endolytic transglycosylase MltG [Gammaproteobacteria bacterium]MDH5309794.1 endolytic transglycosylase MltG [Gammaproteobacteria bacterium]
MADPTRVWRWALATAVAGCLVAGLGIWQFDRYLDRPLALPEAGLPYDVRPGTAFSRIADDLAGQGVLEHPRLLRLHARLTGKAQAVHAGEYLFEPGLTPSSLLDKLVAGDVRLYAFTIVEGWTFRELLAAMESQPIVESTLSQEDWPRVLEELGAPYEHPEGLFLPETYRFPAFTRDIDVLRQAYGLMQQALAEEWEGRDENLPISTPYEALILASIIEKETALASERVRISGVFVRRLQRKMRLQTDPTVIYGVGENFDGNLTRRHLRTDTPYNTYTRAGLPPTPIALPGRAAIHAALHPAPGSELYFVATGLGDGSHKFSETRDEHDAAVREYLARQRAGRRQGGE